MASLKVLTKGSMLTKDEYDKAMSGSEAAPAPYELYKKRFIAACQALGWAMANCGYTIMVGIKEWDELSSGRDSATFVLKGAATWSDRNKNRGGKVIFYAPK